VVGHPGLIEDHRRIRADMNAPRCSARDERVQRHRLARQCGTVGAEALSGGPGDGHSDHLVTGELLSADGRVDHDALPGSRRADEHRQALGTRERPQRLLLLCVQGRGDALRDFPGGALACGVTHVPAGVLGEGGGLAFDCLLLRTDLERRHPPALKCQDLPATDHVLCDRERHVGGHLPHGSLQRDGAQLPRLEDCVVLGQCVLDAVLHWSLVVGDRGVGEKPEHLIRPEVVGSGRLPPGTIEVRAGRERLRAAVLQGEAAQLPIHRRAAVACTEPLHRPSDLTRAARECVSQLQGDSRDLEVPAVLAGVPLGATVLLSR
jgi:hypothetical protein